jgi:hypothetical protein
VKPAALPGSGIADLVGQSVAGQLAAQHAIADSRTGTAPPDLLLERLQAVLVTGERERLRSFVRVLQKALEARN